MKNITLISDWKLRDPYVSLFKGGLLTQIPDAQIFDITHAVEMFMIDQAAFICRASYSNFPKGTLHILLAGNNFSKTSKPILLHYDDHWFLGEDTGVFSILVEDRLDFSIFQYQEDLLISSTEKIIEMAKWFFNNEIEEHTSEIYNLKPARVNLPFISEDKKTIKGKIVYIDSYCNAVTNIPNKMFLEANSGTFVATISSSKYLQITRKHDFYNPNESEIYLLLNRIGFVEITLYHAHIAILGGLKVKDNIEIQFT